MNLLAEISVPAPSTNRWESDVEQQQLLVMQAVC